MSETRQELERNRIDAMVADILPGVVADSIVNNDDLFFEAIGADGILKDDATSFVEGFRLAVSVAVALKLKHGANPSTLSIDERADWLRAEAKIGECVAAYVTDYIAPLETEAIESDLEMYS